MEARKARIKWAVIKWGSIALLVALVSAILFLSPLFCDWLDGKIGG